MKLLLDSVILIDHFNNIPQATDFISKHQHNMAISVITRAEVLTGFHTQRAIQLAKQLIEHFELFPITATEADLAAVLRYEHNWKLPDAFQAAIAKQNKLKLVTRNTKDFNPVKYPFVMVPYKI